MTSTQSPTSWGDEEQLLAAVRHHAKTARQNVTSPDSFVQMDAVVHAGSAVELICKVVLTQVNRLLLHQVSTDVLLASVSPRHPIAKPKRSIEAAAALDLVLKVHPALKPLQTDAARANNQRNDIVHMAIPDPDPAGTVEGMERFVAACMALLHKDASGLFGSRRARELELAAIAIQDQTRQRAEQRISEAGDRYRTLVEGLDDVTRAGFEQAILALNNVDQTDDGFEVECPACGFEDAWLGQEAEYDQDFDGTFYGGMRILGLDCPRCRLALDDVDLSAIEFDTSDPRLPDWAEDYRDDR